MPQNSSTTDVLGIGTVVLIILCCCIGVLSLVYVLSFHFRVGKDRQTQLREFDSPWLVRMVLICFFMLWNLGELFRLPWLRESDRLLHSLGITSQANLCKIHVVWSVGLMEPGLLLTVLFLVRGSLESAPRHINCRVLWLMCLYCLPVFVLQLVVASTSHSNERAFGGKLPSYFTSSYELYLDEGNTTMCLCNYPLFSVLALALFAIAFMPYFACLGYRMLCHVINRRLRLRVYWLVVAVILFLPMHVAFLGVSVRMDPNKTAHEVLMFLGFLALLLCTVAAMGVLVVLPVADAISIECIFKNRERNHQPHDDIQLNLFARNYTGASDEDESSNNLARRSLLESASKVVADIGSSSRDSSLSFDIMPRDLTLGPGAWLVDVPGSLISSGSPPLPGKPLIFL